MPTSNDAALGSRLRLVLTRHSQAEVARRARVPESCVSRYLRGTRMPASFCQSLVREFGVNPAWLLMGEGTPYLSDVTASTSTTATDLLELIQAMSAVAKMRLGELTGQPHRKVLRELNDAMQSYDRIRARLNDQTRPFFRQLIDDLRRATRQGDFRLARDLAKAATQVSRFCDDEDLAADFEAAEHGLEFESGNLARAAELGRRVLLRCFPDGPAHPNFAVESFNYINGLEAIGRLREARRMSNAVLAILADDPQFATACHEFEIQAATLDLELGDVRSGLARIHATVLALDEHFPAAGVTVARAELFSGLNSVQSVLSVGPDNRGKALALLVFSCWLEEIAPLRLACEHFISGADDEPTQGRIPASFPQARRALRLLHVLTKPRALKRSFGEHLADQAPSTANPVHRFADTVYLCQQARLLQDHARGRELLEQAQALLESLPEGYEPRLLQRALHFKNALGLLDATSPLCRRAREFFETHYERGYGCFRNQARPAAAS